MRDSMVSALCGLKMVFGSADETHDGWTNAIATNELMGARAGAPARRRWWLGVKRVASGGDECVGDVTSCSVQWHRVANPKLNQHIGCHKAAVIQVFTATRPSLHTRAQAVEDARGVQRRRCGARYARADSGKAHDLVCSCKIAQRREGDAPWRRMGCLCGSRRDWVNFEKGLCSALCNPRNTHSFQCAIPCGLQFSDHATRLATRACARRRRRRLCELTSRP